MGTLQYFANMSADGYTVGLSVLPSDVRLSLRPVGTRTFSSGCVHLHHASR